MESRTRELWRSQDRHPGDRQRLFRAVARHVPARTVLYPGSFVDIAASFVFPSVTYVDIDRRAAQFFADAQGVVDLIREHTGPAYEPEVAFLHADYHEVALPLGRFDLLISMYAGFVSEACTGALRIGGTLLANPSHGDAALAAINPRYRLSGAVVSVGGDYRVHTDGLDTFLVPKRPGAVTKEDLHRTGRSPAYTRPAHAYLFTRIR